MVDDQREEELVSMPAGVVSRLAATSCGPGLGKDLPQGCQLRIFPGWLAEWWHSCLLT